MEYKFKNYAMHFSFLDLNECDLSAMCHNGGTCHNTHGGYNCSCLPGFAGDGCELGMLTSESKIRVNFSPY